MAAKTETCSTGRSALKVLLCLAGGAVFLLLRGAAPLVQAEWEAYRFREEWPAFTAHYGQGEKQLYSGDYAGALESLGGAIAAAEGRPGFPAGRLAEAYALKGEAHLQLWQYIDAERAFAISLEKAGADRQDALRQRLRAVQETIERNEQERHDKAAYEACPDAGPAQRLQGMVLIAYVFVDDGQLSRWSQEEQQRALANLSRVEAWYQQRAQEYGIADLRFARRVFVYDRDPLLRNALNQLDLKNIQIGYDLAGRVAGLQGGPSVNRFLQRLMEEEKADQAILLLHINNSARSFAMRCRSPCWGDAEYAYLPRNPPAQRLGRGAVRPGARGFAPVRRGRPVQYQRGARLRPPRYHAPPVQVPGHDAGGLHHRLWGGLDRGRAGNAFCGQIHRREKCQK